MLNALRLAGLLAVVLLLGACASAPVAAPGGLPAGDAVAAALGRPEYRIGPNDLLSVTVFQVKDLDREVRVNNLGQVTLPLVGAMDAAGRTVDALEHDISARYAERYLQNPQVSVFVKEFASQRVTVEGAVEKPGIYPMSSRLTLLQAIALAQGLGETASKSDVIVFRTANGERQFARFDLDAISAGRDADPEIQGEDVVVVDDHGGKIFLQNLIKLAPFVAVWRAYR